jgi:hypothetical protein
LPEAYTFLNCNALVPISTTSAVSEGLLALSPGNTFPGRNSITSLSVAPDLALNIKFSPMSLARITSCPFSTLNLPSALTPTVIPSSEAKFV